MLKLLLGNDKVLLSCFDTLYVALIGSPIRLQGVKVQFH